ncbi:hypothetical protein [uncultured Selenomonas sp.]|uniref:hypothetical protein n=1 Tax=uncultured Selenomonas sp. TaxID=159275 RepID=UPI0025F9DAB0|nr:hypothetical protein [uncultured Selenomonas sp.]
MKKQFGKSLLLGLAMMLAAHTGFAQAVVVDGVGTDRQAAIKDASRIAVEEVVGTLVDSKTLTRNLEVQLDEILTKSQGFVKDVQVLEETDESGLVRVRARIDVDTSPDAGLMSNLQMVMALNDPRIAVVVLDQDRYGNVLGHNLAAETALADKLLSLGFHHIIDPQVAASLNDAQLLARIYSGSTQPSAIGSSLGADYLALGRVQQNAQTIKLPDGYGGGYADTLLHSANAILSVKVLRFDTGDIVATYQVSAKGVENSDEMAEQKASENAAAQAAQKLEEKFRHFSSEATGASVELDVFTSDMEAVQQLMADLRTISSVRNVYLREANGDKAILSVETSESPTGLITRLKNTSNLGIFLAGVTGTTAKLSVSR